MTLLERLALGGLCAARALRPAARPAYALPWLLGLVPIGAALALFAWAAHPAVSPVMAPLVRAWAGDAALRYPGLFRHLDALLAGAQSVFAGVLTPLLAGVSAAQFLGHWRGARPDAGRAWRGALPRWPALVIAGAPLLGAAWLVQAALAALAGVPVSAVTRVIAAPLGALLQLLVATGVALAPAAIAEAPGGGWSGLARLPGRAGRGYPAVLVIVGGAAALSAGAHQGVTLATGALEARLPEFALARLTAMAVCDAALACVASAALALAWRALAGEEEY